MHSVYSIQSINIQVKQFLLTYERQKHVHLNNQVSAQAKSIRRTFKGDRGFIFLSNDHTSYLYATREYKINLNLKYKFIINVKLLLDYL